MGVQTHFNCLFIINIELLVFMLFFLSAIEPEPNRQFQSPWGVVVVVEVAAAVVVEEVIVLHTVAAVVVCLLVVLEFGDAPGLAAAGVAVAGGSVVVVVVRQTASLVVGIAKSIFVGECSVEKM